VREIHLRMNGSFFFVLWPLPLSRKVGQAADPRAPQWKGVERGKKLCFLVPAVAPFPARFATLVELHRRRGLSFAGLVTKPALAGVSSVRFSDHFRYRIILRTEPANLFPHFYDGQLGFGWLVCRQLFISSAASDPVGLWVESPLREMMVRTHAVRGAKSAQSR